MWISDLGKDIVSGFALLTRIPVPAFTPRAVSAWTWPLVGCVLSGLSVGLGLAVLHLGVPDLAAGLLVLALTIVLTGGLHEDGLADCADGFWGGRDKARRLEIMKDSRLGSYGVLALIFILALKAVAVASLIVAAPGLILAVAALSRAVMPGMMTVLPNARATGLAHLTGVPGGAASVAAVGVALILAYGAAQDAMIPLAVTVLAIALVCGRIAMAKIQGQTGDVLGATQSLCETGALLTAAAWVS